MLDHEKKEEVRFIENENGWPNWPILPMKRSTKEGVELGVLYGRDLSSKPGDPFEFYPGANMWDPRGWGEPVSKTAAELVAEGWRED
jgi:hypothetical protein